MLRVGLTGELGSGKSTVATMFAKRGAVVLSSDEMGRELMQPGQPVFDAIVAAFGRDVVRPNGTLDRARLAKLAFNPEQPRVEELNEIIHPAVIAAQAGVIAELAAANPRVITMVESALLFSAALMAGQPPWRTRFDAVVLVTAPDEQKIERFVHRTLRGQVPTEDQRTELELDARRRLDVQQAVEVPLADCSLLPNGRGTAELEREVERVWELLVEHEQAAWAATTA